VGELALGPLVVDAGGGLAVDGVDDAARGAGDDAALGGGRVAAVERGGQARRWRERRDDDAVARGVGAAELPPAAGDLVVSGRAASDGDASADDGLQAAQHVLLVAR